jgi:hypothetical protein
MAIDGKKIRQLSDFLAGSFTTSELDMLLSSNDYGEAVSDVDQGVAGRRYFFNVAQALDRRGLIDDTLFACLTKERPKKEAIIRGLQSSWLVDARTPPKAAGSETSAGHSGMIRAEPPAPDHQEANTPAVRASNDVVESRLASETTKIFVGNADSGANFVASTKVVAPLPPELEKLRGLWECRVREAQKDPAPCESFKLYTFFGLDEEMPSRRPIEDEDLRMEMVYHQWADPRYGSWITTKWVEEDGWHLEVEFENHELGHPTNFAIRPEGRCPVLAPQGASLASLTFDARIRPDDEGRARDLQLAIRVVDALQTHWECQSVNGGQKYFPLRANLKDGWASFSIPLSIPGKRDFVWSVFKSDGNWLYRSSRPDFSTVLAPG